MGCLVSAVTCADVTPIELGVCGNGVLEPDENEDCDSTAVGEGTRCAPPGAEHACRYVCLDSDSGETLRCPHGWGCGRDGVCRAHGAALRPPRSFAAVTGRHLSTGDFDGDGNGDISWLFGDRFEVTYVSDDAAFSLERPVPLDGTAFTGDTNQDGRDDWLLPTATGMRSFHGAADRLPRAVTFQSVPLTIDVDQFIPIDLIPDVVLVFDFPLPFAGAESLVVQPGLDTIASFRRGTALIDDIDASLPDAQLAGALAAELDLMRQEYLPAGGPTPEELAVPYHDSDRVVVYRPSFTLEIVGDDEVATSISFNTNPPTEISVPKPRRIVGALHANPVVPAGKGAHTCMLGDPIEDAFLDLVIASDEGLFVTYGRGDGTFHSDPCTLDTTTPDNEARPFTPYLACPDITAMAHLDDDGALDVVTAFGVWTSALLGSSQSSYFCVEGTPKAGSLSFGPWESSAIGDFDGDGHLDVAAAPAGGGLDILAGSGSAAMTETHIGTGGITRRMAVGDLDGNGIDDIAVADDRGDDRLYLSIHFGEPLSAPSTPVELGAVSNIFVMGALDTGSLFPDEIDDLVIGRAPADGEDDRRSFIGVTRGAADRAVSSLFVQAYSFQDVDFFIPRSTALGHFRDPEELDLALVSRRVAAYLDPTVDPFGVGLARPLPDGRLVVMGEHPTTIDIHDNYSHRTMQSVTVDVESDGRDELFVVSSDHSSLRMLLGGFDDEGVWEDGGTLAVDEVALFGDGVAARDVRYQRVLPVLRDPEVCFFDGETPTVLIGALALEACSEDEGAPSQASARVLRLSAPMLADLQNGSLDAIPEEAWMVVGGGAHILGFTCFNGDDDADDELAMLLLDLPEELSACHDNEDVEDLEATARIVMLEREDNGFGEPVTLASLDSQTAASLFLDANSLFPLLSGLATGDMNGDGVDDFVVGAGSVTLVFEGEPVHP